MAVPLKGHAADIHPTKGTAMTPLIHLYLLASGSKGNAAVVEGPQGSVLVDCGISRRELHRRADLAECDLSRVCAMLVTHEHGDHTSGLSVLSKHFDGPIYATAGTADARSHLSRLPFTPMPHDGTLELGGMHVQAFPLSHDVVDPMCFRFEVRQDGAVVDAVGWATDTGVLTKEAELALHGCRTLGIESNHDEVMLANGPYPYYLRVRVGGSHGHLSNAQAAKALPKLMTDETETVVGMHVSEKNNRPDLVLKSLEVAVAGQAKVLVASQTEPLVIW